MTVLIIGAGIGGLVLALELHRLRIPVRVYEAGARLSTVRVEIDVAPDATHILAQLGLPTAEGALQNLLLRAFLARIGPDHLFLGHRCIGVQQDDSSVSIRFEDGTRKRGSIAVACDGIDSAIRKQFYPQEGETQEPLARWSFGRVTLLGDAAYPRGSDGAGQSILDARALAEELAAGGDPVAALKAYEKRRIRTPS